jgi:Na+-driven multidrug efflux pump
MLIGFMIFELIPDKLLLMFNATPGMLDIGIIAFRIVAINFLFAGFCIVSVSVFQAMGMGMATLFISVARQLVVLLPVAWLLSLTGTVKMVWWCFPISEMASVLLCIFFMKRVYSRKIKKL